MTFPLRAAMVVMLSLTVIAPAAVHADALHAAIAGPATADGDLPVAFDGSGSTGTIVQYVWDFGHGTAPVTTTVPSVSHRFGAYGRFKVTLTVHDNGGATDSANLTIETNGFGPGNYRVTPVYFVPTNRTLATDWEPKFQTAMELISRFYAENLEMNGFGYRPLNMELGANGRPVIRLVIAQHEDEYYLPYGTYDVGGAQQRIQQELEAITDLEEQECLMVVADVEWYDPAQTGPVVPWTGGRAFPGRGGFSVAGMPFRWLGTTVAEQMVIFDDPTWDADRGPTTRGQNASTLIGGMAHELGHAFGMQHTPEFNDIMALGLYEFRDYFVPVPYGGIADLSRTTAMGFDNVAFFRSDHPFADNSNPTIKMLPPLVLHGQPVTIPVEIGDTGGSDPALLHIYFNNVTWDSIDVRGLGASFTLPYTFPGAETLDNGLHAYGAMIYDGDSNRELIERGFQVVDSIPPIPPPIAVDPTEWVWGEDGIAAEALTIDHWAWQTTVKNSGDMALYQESTSAKEAFNAWYGDYPNPLELSPGEQVSAYLYITPGSSLDGVAIELGAWYGGGIRLVWGDDPYPPLWAQTSIRIGDVPPAGGWVRLTVPASLFIAAPERYTNMAMRAHGTGVLFWDRLGKVPAPAVCGNGVPEPPEGCDDGNVTPGDGCDASCAVEPGFACAGTPSTCTAGCGDGVVAGSEGCDDGNTANGDCCGADCQLDPAGSPCDDDGDLCSNDTCAAGGVCHHAVAPDPDCLLPTASGKAQLRIVNASKAQVQLKWTTRSVVPKAIFGTPSSGVPQYALCVYDHVAGAPTAVVNATAVGDADCSDKTCWTENKSGWRLKSATGAPDGIVQLQLTKSKLQMKLKGGFLTLPTLPLAAAPRVVAQVRSSDGQCYGAVFSTPIKNGTDGYRAKSD